MSKVKLTSGRVMGFKCPEDKPQAFLWCNEVPGLAVRATPGSRRNRYIFQSKVKRQSVRLTIGDVNVWSIGNAQIEARRLQILIDQGYDPRQIKIEQAAINEASIKAMTAQKARDAVTVGLAWEEYLFARKSFWGDRHYNDHLESMQAGGEQRSRSKKLTTSGALASLASIRLVDLRHDMIMDWATIEGNKRPGRARLASRLLSGFLSWCAEYPAYREIVKNNPVKNKATREILGKSQKKNDALQREQLPSWFAEVKQINNSIVSAYLQILLLTGARPNELITARWEDVDFQWNSVTIRDKVEGWRVIPLTPYVSYLLSTMHRRNEWVFSSSSASSGHLSNPHGAHYRVCAAVGFDVTLHGLRRSFASLCEWIECPAGIAAQIQGHAPQGVREQHYIRRPIDLLRMWHIKIEAWILEQAGIEFVPIKAGMHIATS